MNLRELFEATHHKATVAFCFGRFNPPHQGHAKVWEAVKHAGQHWYIGTNPTTIGPNDPLDFNTKTAWMTAIDPDVAGHILGETSIVTLAARIYKEVGDGATIAYVTDETDWAWSGKLLNDYNGKESNHGYFNFAKIIHVPSPRVSSATALRTAARAGDMDAFYQAAGTDPNLEVNGQHYFDTVVAAVGAHPEKVKKAKKEKATPENLGQNQPGMQTSLGGQWADTGAKFHQMEDIEEEGLMGFLEKPKKPAASAEEMRKYFEKEKAKDPDKIERGQGDKKAQQVYTRSDETSVKYINNRIREMRAQEFMRKQLAEDVPWAGKGGEKLHHSQLSAIKNAMSIPNISMNKANGSPYMQYRFGLAMANPDMPPAGAMSGDPLITAYTDAELEKVKAAAKTMNAGAITKLSDGISDEAFDTHTVSPVAKPKKNQYGV